MNVNTEFFIVRHVDTREVMTTSNGKGGFSHWEPGKPESFYNGTKTPRLFETRDSANRAITQWARGVREWNATLECYMPTNKTGRKRSDMVIEPVAVIY